MKASLPQDYSRDSKNMSVKYKVEFAFKFCLWAERSHLFVFTKFTEVSSVNEYLVSYLCRKMLIGLQQCSSHSATKQITIVIYFNGDFPQRISNSFLPSFLVIKCNTDVCPHITRLNVFCHAGELVTVSFN